MSIGQQTYQEIMAQPQAWKQTFARFPEYAAALKTLTGKGKSKPTHFFWTGCGSAYFISQTLASLTQAALNVPSSAVPASEMMFYPQSVFHARYKPWLVAISRSGETSETLQAVKSFKSIYPEYPVIAITCEAKSRLAKAADVVLVADAPEKGIVQTASLTTLLLVGLGAVSRWSKQPIDASLTEEGEALLKQHQRLALKLGSDRERTRFFFLGSGPLRGLANECMLKVKEMSWVQSEAFHTMEFRHGLGANADSHSVIIGLLAEKKSILQQELAVLEEMQGQGAQIVTLGPTAPPKPVGDHIQLGVKGLGALPLYLPFIQLMAHYRAIMVGNDPDNPTRLKPFIKLDL